MTGDEVLARAAEDFESPTVDFKQTSGAFAPGAGADRDKAELVKDLVALANNRAPASYLILGVTDTPPRQVVGFTSPYFTDENLHDLVATAITPVPPVVMEVVPVRTPSGEVRVRVIRVASGHHEVIYRVKRDQHGKDKQGVGRLFFREGEVWVRRGSTCRLAVPEDYGELLPLPPAARRAPALRIGVGDGSSAAARTAAAVRGPVPWDPKAALATADRARADFVGPALGTGWRDRLRDLWRAEGGFGLRRGGVEAYNAAWREYKVAVIEALHDRHAALERGKRQVDVTLRLAADGPTAAYGVTVELTLPVGVDVVLPGEEPAAPVPPTRPQPSDFRPTPSPRGVGGPAAPPAVSATVRASGVGTFASASEPRVERAPPQSGRARVVVTVPRVSQHQATVVPLRLLLEPALVQLLTSPASPLALEYRAFADNVPGAATGTLEVMVTVEPVVPPPAGEVVPEWTHWLLGVA